MAYSGTLMRVSNQVITEYRDKDGIVVEKFCFKPFESLNFMLKIDAFFDIRAEQCCSSFIPKLSLEKFYSLFPLPSSILAFLNKTIRITGHLQHSYFHNSQFTSCKVGTRRLFLGTGTHFSAVTHYCLIDALKCLTEMCLTHIYYTFLRASYTSCQQLPSPLKYRKILEVNRTQPLAKERIYCYDFEF